MQLDELSKSLRVERHTIERAIKRTTGNTFREFRARLLLEKAKRVLDEDPLQSIKEVAFILGYSSQRAFCRFTKANAGCSPTELRDKKHKKAETAIA
jgi:two-component system response regulator YesN